MLLKSTSYPPYDKVAANELIDMGVEIFKTASADIVDLALHSYLSNNAKKVIVRVEWQL